MNVQKLIFSLFIVIGSLFVSCSSDDESKDYAQVLVTVVSATGERLPNETVHMFDEKAYEEFKKNNLTNPTTFSQTNSDGVATFIFINNEWFQSGKDRFFTFVVQYGGGKDNYEIWSLGRIIRPGSTTKVELKLQNSFQSK